MRKNNKGGTVSKYNDPVTLTVEEVSKFTLCNLRGKTTSQTSRIMKWSKEFTRKFNNNDIVMTIEGDSRKTIHLKVIDLTELSEGERNEVMEECRNQGPLKVPDSLKYRMMGNN